MMSLRATLGIIIAVGLTLVSRQAGAIEIDRIEIQGVKAFPATQIEGTLELAPGDQLERLKVIRTEENLQSLYFLHGYQGMSVQSRLARKSNESKNLETVLEFKVSEGVPSRISEIQISSQGLKEKGVYRTRESLERKIKALMSLSKGDIYDEDKVSEGKRAIQEFLALEEYIGAKVDVTHASTAPSWVKVDVNVDLGEKVSFGFRGNTVFTRGYLDSLVDEQRLVGLGKDYVGAIRTRLEAEYRSAGFSRVQITAYTLENTSRSERQVTYIVEEGPRVKLQSIDFDGNHVFSSDELREQFFSAASGIVQHGFYVESDVQKAAELMIEWMKEKGYLAAKLVTISSIYPPQPKTHQANSAVKLIVYLYEGEQTLVQSLTFSGNQVLKLSDIKNFLHVGEGNALNLFAFTEGLEALKKAYRDRGYLSFKIMNEGTDTLISYSHENHLADISLQMDEGPQYHVSQIEIDGVAKTKEFIIRRELNLKKGDVLGESRLIESKINLQRLGIFSVVTIKPIDDPGQAGYKIVRISVQEADRGTLTWGPGFRNDLGVRLFSQLAYSNLWGLNHTGSINASVNRRFSDYNFPEGQIQFSYLWPWFGLPGLTFRPAISAGQTQYINFAADTLTASASWEKPLLKYPNLTGNLTYTWESIYEFNAEAVATTASQHLQIGTVTPRLSIDLRDDPLSPTSGLFATAWLDLAYPPFGSQDLGYYRFQFRSDYSIPLGKAWVWYLSFRTGYEINTVSTLNQSGPAIPLIKQFALGGIGSLRGYQEQELNNQDSYIKGSLAYVNYRTEIDFPFAGALKAGIFLDAANLLIDNFSFGGLRYSAGFGFHYQTPVGPVNLDWGFKLDRPGDSSTDQIHFSIGVI